LAHARDDASREENKRDDMDEESGRTKTGPGEERRIVMYSRTVLTGQNRDWEDGISIETGEPL
jgi:hypothetical protein